MKIRAEICLKAAYASFCLGHEEKNDEVLLGVFLLRFNREKFSASVWYKGNGSAIWDAWKRSA